MKNKFLIGLITFFIGIIFCITILNISESSSKNNYFFERSFSQKDILVLENEFESIKNKGSEILSVPSENSIVECEMEYLNDEVKYKFFINNLNFSNRIIKIINLPKTSNILLCNENELYYANKFVLFKYDFILNKHFKIGLNEIKIFSIKPLKNDKSAYLCLGEYYHENKYITGFFLINSIKNTIKAVKVIQTNDKTAIPNAALLYTGNFITSIDNNSILFYCDKYSKIFNFEIGGKFVNELITYDKTPLPTILTNSNGDSFYSRGGTWSTNFGVIKKNDFHYVFTCRSEEKDLIIIDQYSNINKKYIQSYKLKYKNMNSKNIKNFIIHRNGIILCFESNYASFTFSRNI